MDLRSNRKLNSVIGLGENSIMAMRMVFSFLHRSLAIERHLEEILSPGIPSIIARSSAMRSVLVILALGYLHCA